MRTKELFQLLQWDMLLLHRNKLIVLSLVVALIYVGIFYLLKPLGNLTTMLIILLFNDPVVTGFMFAGVMYLFDKNQNTLQAIQVVPLPFSYYLLSKTVILTALATITAFMMSFAVYGFHFQYFHLFYGVAATAVFFILCGYIFASYSPTFNHFLLYTIGFLVIMGVAFLELFDIGKSAFYMIFPSFAGLKLIQAAFVNLPLWQLVYAYFYLTLILVLLWPYTINTLNRQIA